MIDLMNKGWLKVPGIRPKGDRTLEEQMLGLDEALAECAGKSVLDLGCAEGLIGREFARAGAAMVVGVESLEGHLTVAREACREFNQMSFIHANLKHYIQTLPKPWPRFDIVLALGIIHKLVDPAVPLRFAAKSAISLLCFRAPARNENGVVRGKHSGIGCNVPMVMADEGYVEERLVQGVRGEAVQYWRRK